MNIDIFKEASARREMRFSVKVSSLPRVLEVLPDSDSSELAVFLSFGIDGNDQRYVDVNLEGTLFLRCQRCLEAMPFLLQTSHRLSPVKLDQVEHDLLGDLEPIFMDENGLIDVTEMLEEEVLLGLPMCPMHEKTDCSSDFPESPGLDVPQKKRKSFAGLAELLNQKSV